MSVLDAPRVAMVPASHPYVEGLGLGELGIAVLDDPPVPGAPGDVWWPPAMLDPEWILAHAGDFDVMHVHFGCESLPAGRLTAALDALRRVRRPLVHTVHDIDNPQLADQTRHHADLDRLVVAAAQLVTLTPGAAAELARRHPGRSQARVIRHPALAAEASTAGADGPPSRDAAPVVGIHLRDLRPGIDGPGSVATAIAALGGRTGPRAPRLRVAMRAEVRDRAAADAVRRLCRNSSQVELVEAGRPEDGPLAAELDALAVSVLPYRHGTHSGWLELCWDLGVPVAGPALGHFAEQHAEPSFYAGFTPGSAVALRAALTSLLARPAAVAGSPPRAELRTVRRAARDRERRAIARAHLDVYREAIGRG